MVQENTGKFFIIFANILVTIISLGFAYLAFILARLNDTIGAYELWIIIAATLTVIISWLFIILYLKKDMKKLLFFFFIAGLICIILLFFGQGLSTLIPGAFYLIGSLLIFYSKDTQTEDDTRTVQLHNNWKLTFIFVGNILNTFIWIFFCYIFLLLIGNHLLLAKLLNTTFNESFTIFLIISTLIFITLNWVIYFIVKLKDIRRMYFYFLIVSIINILIGVYNIAVLNGGSFPPPETLLSFVIQAPVFLFIFPGLLYIIGFAMRDKDIVYTEELNK